MTGISRRVGTGWTVAHRPADVTELVAFLVSDSAGWITGKTTDSDGRWGVGV